MMRFEFLILTSMMATAQVFPENTTNILKREEVKAVDNTPLQSQNSPFYTEIHYKGEWHSHWLMATVGALAYTQPDELRKVYKDVGTGENRPGENTNKAEFYLYNSAGEKQTITVDQQELSPDADFTYEDGAIWWYPGLETAALSLSGYLGLDTRSISWGDPVNAFFMLTGKQATYETVTEQDQLKNIMMKCKKMPVVIGTSSGQDYNNGFKKWSWYTVLDYTKEDKYNEDGSRVSNAVTIYNYDSEGLKTLMFDQVWSNVYKVVYLDPSK